MSTVKDGLQLLKEFGQPFILWLLGLHVEGGRGGGEGRGGEA